MSTHFMMNKAKNNWIEIIVLFFILMTLSKKNVKDNVLLDW